jgi:hypothetical protein
MKVTKFSPAISAGLNLIMNKLLLLLVLCLAVTTFSQAQDPLSPSNLPVIDTNAADYPSNIWVTDTMQKVQQQTGSPGSAHWGTFYGTQGEFIDFQVHVQAPAGGYSALTIAAGSFVQTTPASYTIAAPSASYNGTLVYREAYYHVSTITSAASVYYGTTGYYPDPLIPTIDPYHHQTTNAFPVAVTAGYNQSAWVDVFIPFGAPSGYYLGAITVSNNGTTLATLPIILAVWQWPSSQGGHMPATASLPSELQYGSGDFCNMNYPGTLFNSTGCNVGTITYPNGASGANVDGAAMFLDHRWSMNDPVSAGTTSQASTYYGPLFGGTNGVNVSTIIPGARSTGVRSVSISGSMQTWDTFVNVTNRSAWPQLVNYDYTANEPGYAASSWTSLCNAATTDHGLNPPLATLITSYIQNMTYNAGTAGCTTQGVSNSVDIIVTGDTCLEPSGQYVCSAGNGSQYPSVGLNLSAYSSWLSHTNPDGIKPSFWSYLACGNSGTCGNGTVGATYANFSYANYNVDSKPAGNRVEEWLTYFHQQSGTLYYYATCSWETACGTTTQNDPWATNLYQFGNNGDGTLAYPSSYQCTSNCGTDPTPVNHVTQQNGSKLAVPIWVPRLVLKQMRDGMQDYEYLNALTVAGDSSYVNTQIQSWITNSYTYEYTGTGLQAARNSLGTKLHQLTYPTVLLPPPSLNGSVQP